MRKKQKRRTKKCAKCKADLALAAAAPELLSALELASAALVEMMKDKTDLTIEAHYRAIDAIRKAKGLT